jgi:hypothetical protein
MRMNLTKYKLDIMKLNVVSFLEGQGLVCKFSLQY